MKSEPILVLLAAGMGSRYGGLKQIDPLGPNGEILMDYSLYDARRAGFRRVVFIIKKQDEAAFQEAIGERIRREFEEVRFAFQGLEDLPEGFVPPEGRVKPWGTAHAVLAARAMLDAPFAVINADDYYGPDAFVKAYRRLSQGLPEGEALLVTYILGKTLSEYGTVSRGICQVKNGRLVEIVERRKVRDNGEKAAFTEDGGENWEEIDKESPVSMNFWGFRPDFVDELKRDFLRFQKEELPLDLLKAEFLIPTVADTLIRSGKLQVICELSQDRWFGVTYHEDRPKVIAALLDKIAQGAYPEKLWS